jgi:hypothetical protein
MSFTPKKKKKNSNLKTRQMFLHIIKSNILFYICPRYEIIWLTFEPSKVVEKNL